MTRSGRSLGSSGHFQNFGVFSLWKNRKTCEARATWLCSLAGPGTGLLAAQNHLLGAPNFILPQLIFVPGKTVSIITRAVPATPEPFPWKGAPELAFRSGLLSAEAPTCRGGTGRRSCLGLSRVRGTWGASALIKQEKGQGQSGDITLQGRGQFQTMLRTFLMTMILKGKT